MKGWVLPNNVWKVLKKTLKVSGLYSGKNWELNLFDHPVYGDWEGHDPSLGYDLLDGPKKVCMPIFNF